MSSHTRSFPLRIDVTAPKHVGAPLCSRETETDEEELNKPHHDKFYVECDTWYGSVRIRTNICSSRSTFDRRSRESSSSLLSSQRCFLSISPNVTQKRTCVGASRNTYSSMSRESHISHSLLSLTVYFTFHASWQSFWRSYWLKS